MKPARFDYVAPSTVEDALSVLAAADLDTSVLAGGQSLLPMLNMRLARPALVVDLNRTAGLDRITVGADGTVRIDAMVQQRELETSGVIRERLPLLTQATGHIAHVAIRTRGTVGGSLAHADPAAELPAVMAALRARLHVRRNHDARIVSASEFFRGPLTTALEPGELLVGVEIDALPPGTGSAFLEVSRTHGAFALVGAAALVRTGADGWIDFARLALCGAGAVPYVPEWLDDIVLGELPGEALFANVAERVSAGVVPLDDESSDYRRGVSGVLAARALAAATSSSTGAPKT